MSITAIALVSPNNPGGAEYPAETLRAFPDMEAGRRLRFTAVIEEESQQLAQRVGALGVDAGGFDHR